MSACRECARDLTSEEHQIGCPERDGPESCGGCLLDIARDAGGRWRLAWWRTDDTTGPYECDGSKDGHKPRPPEGTVSARPGMANAAAAAERRAEFSRLRDEGLGIVDAGVRVGVSYQTACRYERWRNPDAPPDLAAKRDWTIGRGGGRGSR